MRKKVILLIGTLSGGGAERAVSNISMSFEENIETEIILFGSDAKIEYEYKGNITYLDQGSPKNLLSKFTTLIKRIFKLRKLKKNNNVSVISFLEYPNLLNMLSGKMKKSIVSVRNFMSTKHKKGLKAYFWNFTIKYFYKRAYRIVVVSQQMKKDLINNYNLPSEKICVINNSYPIEQIEGLANEELTKKEQDIFRNPVIITSGRLHKQKGHKHLLNAFKQVNKLIPHTNLVFLGEGNLKDSLEAMAKELGIETNVYFLGFQHNPFKYIARSKVFVMTSYYEGFPNALAEAMACKVPVISTDCPSGPREILAPKETKEKIDYTSNEHRYGFLVPEITENNYEEIEQQISRIIKELIRNKQIKKLFAEKSQQRIRSFHVEKIIGDWEQIIKKTNYKK